MHWHYSKRMPIGKTNRYGVWEDDRYIGCVLFARGAAPGLASPYGLDLTECVELVRVALREHRAPVTEIVAHALRALKAQSPGVRLVVSFADPVQGHVGGIYKAGNWIYTGTSAPTPEWFYRGKWRHNRDVTAPGFVAKRGAGAGLWLLDAKQRAALPHRKLPGKHRYLAMRRRVAALALPYPQPAVEGSTGAVTPPR